DCSLDELADELTHFHGLDSLKRLIWELLGYERIDEPLPRDFFPRGVADSLLSQRLFARHEDLHVLCVQIQEGRFLKNVRRAVAEVAARKLSHGVILLVCDYAWRRI